MAILRFILKEGFDLTEIENSSYIEQFKLDDGILEIIAPADVVDILPQLKELNRENI